MESSVNLSDDDVVETRNAKGPSGVRPLTATTRPPSAKAGPHIATGLASMVASVATSVAASSSSKTTDDMSDESDETDDDDDDDNGGHLEGAYDPAEFEYLTVSSEIKDLFSYIPKYSPQTVELTNKMKPFIPDFIPAVGDIDAFIKVSRPDNQNETLGLLVLDEPCAKQTDPTVLDLQLRAISKQSTSKGPVVKSLADAEKNPKEIESWIRSINDLHRSKPAPTVHYTRNMPDIESLMQEWDPGFEDLLKEVGLPSADLECSLAEYVDMACAIVDIPVNKSRIQSLHVLFSLYQEFKNSQHFKLLADENQIDNSLKIESQADRLIIE